MFDDFLQEILKYKQELLEKKKVFLNELKKKIDRESLSQYHLFKKAISKTGEINLIAEIKKASPSKGVICKDFNVLRLAEIYVRNKASAISILTEDKFFAGKPSYIKVVSENFKIPVLAKDFIIDEMQIYEAFYCGASAILLIVAILSEQQLKHLMSVAARLDLDCLVEIHDEAELEKAINVGAEIIGVNNRNLHTLEVDLGISQKIIPKIPKGKIIVAESGIKTHEEIQMLKNLGTNAVLIGETFLRAPDINHKISELMYGQS